jgi:hypothetical protein
MGKPQAISPFALSLSKGGSPYGLPLGASRRFDRLSANGMTA